MDKLENSIYKILSNYKIEIDLPLENIINTAKENLSAAHKEAVDILEKAKISHKSLIDNPVQEPINLYSISGKQYDLKDFVGIDHLKYISKKENIISKKQSELSTYENQRTEEKKETSKSVLSYKIDSLSGELMEAKDKLEDCKFIIDASLKYKNQFDVFSEYKYTLTESETLVKKWEKIAFIFSSEGPLLNKDDVLDKKELPLVPSGATVLSIKQPWASLIMNKYKTIECRNWKPGRKFILPKEVYIHATKPYGDPYYLVKELQFYCRIDKLSEFNFLKYEPGDDDFEYGSIIAKATLSEIIEFKGANHYSQYTNEALTPYPYYSYKYGFRFTNVEPVKPTPIKGKLMFWKYREE
jgi:hypothetical protein